MLTSQRVSQAVVILAIAGILRASFNLIVQMTIAAKFGASSSVDAYLISLTIPNMLGDFFVGGVILLAFIPVFIEYKTTKGEREAWQISNTLINIAGITLFLGVIVYYLLIPSLVPLLVPGFTEETRKLAISLMKITCPLLLFFGLITIFRGILHSYQHFIIPSFSPLTFTLSILAGAFFLSERLGIYGLAFGAVFGGFIHMIIQALVLIRAKIKYYDFQFFFNHPGVRKVFKLILPILGVTVTYNIIIIIIRLLASILGEGNIAALNFAFQIVMFPVTIVAASIGVATYPTFSQHAAKKDFNELIRTFSLGIRMILFITIPIAVGLMLFCNPIIQLLFERGLFDSEATQLTATALFYLSLGLFAFASNILIIRVFYSLQDMITPLKVGILALLGYIILNLALIKYLALGGLALVFSIYSIFTFFLLILALKQKLKNIEGRRIFITFLKVILASIVMGIGIYLLARHIGFWLVVIIGVTIFILMAMILKIEEIKEIRAFAKSIFLRNDMQEQ